MSQPRSSDMNRLRRVWWIGALVALTSVIPASAASALSNTNGTPQSDMDKLKDKGYDCGRAGVGGYDCTKGGSKYYCDNAGKCEHVSGPFARTGRTQRPRRAGRPVASAQ